MCCFQYICRYLMYLWFQILERSIARTNYLYSQQIIFNWHGMSYQMVWITKLDKWWNSHFMAKQGSKCPAFHTYTTLAHNIPCILMSAGPRNSCGKWLGRQLLCRHCNCWIKSKFSWETHLPGLHVINPGPADSREPDRLLSCCLVGMRTPLILHNYNNTLWCTMSAGEHPTQNHKKLNIHAMSQSNKMIGLNQLYHHAYCCSFIS